MALLFPKSPRLHAQDNCFSGHLQHAESPTHVTTSRAGDHASVKLQVPPAGRAAGQAGHGVRHGRLRQACKRWSRHHLRLKALAVSPLIRMAAHPLTAQGWWQVHALLPAPWAHGTDWNLLSRMAGLADQRFSYNVATVVCHRIRIANVFGMKLYLFALQRAVHSISTHTIQMLCSTPFLLIAFQR